MSDLSIFILCTGVFAALIAPLAALDDSDGLVGRLQRVRRVRLHGPGRRRTRPRRRTVVAARVRDKQDRRRAA
jgi:hypothetical protein